MSGAFIGMSIDTSIRLDVYRSEGCHHRRNGSPLLLMVFTQRCSTLRVYLTGIPSFSFFGVTSKCNYGQSESKQKTDGRLSRSVAFHLGGTAWYIYRLAFFRVIIALFIALLIIPVAFFQLLIRVVGRFASMVIVFSTFITSDTSVMDVVGRLAKQLR